MERNTEFDASEVTHVSEDAARRLTMYDKQPKKVPLPDYHWDPEEPTMVHEPLRRPLW